MKAKDDRLLREFVREVLKEDDTGGAGYGGIGDFAGGSGMGYMNYGKDLKSIFIQPFVDAGGVIKASTSKALLRMKTLAKVSIEAILTTMIPFLKSNYEGIFKQEQEQLKKLKEKYKKAFEGVEKAFYNDVMVISFMISPEAFITAKLAQQAPRQVLGMLEVLTAGNEGLVTYFDDIKKRLDAIDKDIKDDPANYKIGPDGRMVPKNQRGPYLTQKKRDLLKKAGLSSGLARDGQSLAEAPVAQPFEMTAQQRMGEEVARALKNPDVQKEIARSPYAAQMRGDAKALAADIERRVLGEASRVLSAQSLEDLQKILGRPVEVSNLQTLDPQDQEAEKAAVLSQVKLAAKDFYLQALKADVEGLQKDGVDPNNLYIQALQSIISKIAAL
jgi:regulator of RNase E activity RraB